MKILFFNPRSAPGKHRLPNTILQLAASLDSAHEWFLVDGNLEQDPLQQIENYITIEEIKVFACTVMPGPQLKQAIPVSQALKEKFPGLKIVWGGYFPSNQSNVVIESSFVDFVVCGQGDLALNKLLGCFQNGLSFSQVPNLVWKKNNEIVSNEKSGIIEPDLLNPLPYHKLEQFYPIENYFGRTFMGSKTFSFHSSVGCPHQCSFCGVVPIYNGCWKGLSALKLIDDIVKVKQTYHIDSIEFHDNNFFSSRERVLKFAEGIKDQKLSWWAEGRVDALNRYKDNELETLRDSGCRMIFMGAETGNDEALARMEKGGTQSASQVEDLVRKMRVKGIVPELSFVLGFPEKDENALLKRIADEIGYIRKLKYINPEAEIIIYLYSPVPAFGSELYEQIKKAGFGFPEKLEEWLHPAWEKFDLRKNPLTPWLTARAIRKIRNFELVLSAYYPSKTDFHIKGVKRFLLRLSSWWRYKTGIYVMPLELKVLLKFMRYHRPEKGFYKE